MHQKSAESPPLVALSADEPVRDVFSFHASRSLNYDETAPLLTEIFGQKPEFSRDHMQWAYETATPEGSLTISAYKNGDKVGQIAFQLTRFVYLGREFMMGNVIDMAMSRRAHSMTLTRRLMQNALKTAREFGLDAIIGVPNRVATRVTQHYLGGEIVAHLALQAGIALPVRSRQITLSRSVVGLSEQEMTELALPYLRNGFDHQGRSWAGSRLYRRLVLSGFDYHLHATADTLLISRKRPVKGVMVAFLAGFLSRLPTVPRREIRLLTQAACKAHRTSTFLYMGYNDQLEALPGFALPEKLRTEPWDLRMSWLADGPPPHFDHFEGIDFDIV